MRQLTRPVFHLELHTADLEDACAFYALLCGWKPERVHSGMGSYLALDLGAGIGGGIVESSREHALWLPYVEVRVVSATTERAQALGASVLLEPREGRYGWRSVVSAPAGGEVAFWERKTHR